MIKKIWPFFFLLCMAFFVSFGQLTDQKSTPETKNLYHNLSRMEGKSVLFGHQDDMAYGVGWKYQEGRSDIKDLTGEYPAVFGWDVAGLETDQKVNIDGVPFEKMKQYIKKAYDMGAISTLSWHMNNPYNKKTSWDTSSMAVKSILPNGTMHSLYKSWLDKFSVFAKSLKGSDGKAIPILFRPFHENGGAWFWWGTTSCTPEQYKQLWQFTVNYLKNEKKLHNLIYVFNPCNFTTEAEYLKRYPGDAYADVLSFDHYQYGVEKGESFAKEMARNLAIQHQIAVRTGKISAIAETGLVEIPDAHWWTTIFAGAIAENKPAYVLFWRNAGYREQEKDNHYYAPYPGQVSAADFLNFIKNNPIILQKGLKSIYK